ncbi:MAG TPA: GNAT family N-acetyltransferase [Acetobacteraceae bacterium]|nr:GNAT family N-acetyltransferase [Acetobacteraceae bacterium]
MAHRLITCSDAPSMADFWTIFQALDDATALVVGPAQIQPLAVLLHDCKGVVIGGLWGRTIYSWLMIEMLVVPPALRKQGVGSALMRRAERVACERGCIGMQVSTFDFQAKDFYEHLGFTVFGAQEDIPPGHTLLYLSKRLDPALSLPSEHDEAAQFSRRSMLLASSWMPPSAAA